MKNLKRKLHIYWPFSKSVIQVMLSYRINFFMFVFGDLLKTFVIYYLWKAVFMNSSSSTLNGFTVSDMIIYIFISNITLGTIMNNVDSVIGSEVKDGSIAINLIRPINYHIRMLFHSLGSLLYGTAFVGIPLWIGLVLVRYFSAGELPPDIVTILVYLLSLALGFLIMFLFNFCFGLIAFYVTNLWGVAHLKNALVGFFSGEIIPIAFFPLWLQNGLKFVPFGSINYTPVMIYLRKITGTGIIMAIGVQLLWLALLFFISRWLWNRAVNRLTILGG